MNNISLISEKVNIQSVAKHFLYGKDPCPASGKSYEERNDDALNKFAKQCEAHPENTEDYGNELAAEISELYMEIGIKMGMRLALDILCSDRSMVDRTNESMRMGSKEGEQK